MAYTPTIQDLADIVRRFNASDPNTAPPVYTPAPAGMGSGLPSTAPPVGDILPGGTAPLALPPPPGSYPITPVSAAAGAPPPQVALPQVTVTPPTDPGQISFTNAIPSSNPGVTGPGTAGLGTGTANPGAGAREASAPTVFAHPGQLFLAGSIPGVVGSTPGGASVSFPGGGGRYVGAGDPQFRSGLPNAAAPGPGQTVAGVPSPSTNLQRTADLSLPPYFRVDPVTAAQAVQLAGGLGIPGQPTSMADALMRAAQQKQQDDQASPSTTLVNGPLPLSRRLG